MRPLCDDGANSATAATRDHVLTLQNDGAQLLYVFGGRITTYRRLSEVAMAKLAPFSPTMGGGWTKTPPLPGGDFAGNGVERQIENLISAFLFLGRIWARRLIQTYGTDAALMLEDANSREDLGEDFGATLTAAEVEWLMDHEFAQTAEDVLWWRTKLGLRMGDAEAEWLEQFMVKRREKRDDTHLKHAPL